MKRFKQLLTFGLALSLTAVPVLAEDAIITENRSQAVEINATVGSSFEVTIPKEITLSKETGSGSGTYKADIPVTVKGDIPTNQVITVDTTDTITLTNTSANETTDATITKGETEFDFDTLTGGKVAETAHLVSANLTPGTWEGTAVFSINLGVPEIKYEQLLFSWSPSDGYEIKNEQYVKMSDDYLQLSDVINGIKVKYTALNGDTAEEICTTENLGLVLDANEKEGENGDGVFGVMMIGYSNIYDYTLTNGNWDENGFYMYVGSTSGTMNDTVTINGTEYHALEDCTIEIYAPAE